MLLNFLLSLIDNPRILNAFKKNPEQIMTKNGMSDDMREALKKGDLHTIRSLLYKEVRRVKGQRKPCQPYMASDYTVSTSCDTPHCPVNVSGSFHKSFWNIMEPNEIWKSEGLTIVGTGIRAGLQTSPEAMNCIRNASKVLFLVADLVSQLWIQKLNPTAESMQRFYKKGKYRLDIYNEIIKKILSELRNRRDLCVVFYGHPGVFVYPAHEAIRIAREEGFKARMLPGISAEDNLFADLGIDPGVTGVQSYEATNFLLNKYHFDTSAGLILWQIGICGYAYWNPKREYQFEGLKVLTNYLKDYYGLEHPVILYEASELTLGNPKLLRLPLSELPHTKISGVATLYVPPKSIPCVDVEMAKSLGIPLDE